jgi:hypothetical protein
LYFSLTGLFGLAVVGAAQLSAAVNATVELVEFPAQFSEMLVKSILLDFGVCYGIEWFANTFFSDNKPDKSLGLDDEEWEAMASGKNAESVVVKSPNYAAATE